MSRPPMLSCLPPVCSPQTCLHQVIFGHSLSMVAWQAKSLPINQISMTAWVWRMGNPFGYFTLLAGVHDLRHGQSWSAYSRSMRTDLLLVYVMCYCRIFDAVPLVSGALGGLSWWPFAHATWRTAAYIAHRAGAPRWLLPLLSVYAHLGSYGLGIGPCLRQPMSRHMGGSLSDVIRLLPFGETPAGLSTCAAS